MLLGSGEFHENRCSEAIHEGHKLHSACIFYMFNLLLKKKWYMIVNHLKIGAVSHSLLKDIMSFVCSFHIYCLI
jgi:hypothetical protein